MAPSAHITGFGAPSEIHDPVDNPDSSYRS